MLAAGHFAEIGCRGAVLAAHTQTLQQPRKHQQDRCSDANRCVSRSQRNHQRTRAHQRYRKHQRRLAPMPVRPQSHQPATQWPHQESHGKHGRRIQQLRGAIALRKECLGEVEGKCGVDIPVIPLDQIAHGSAEYGAQALAWGHVRHADTDTVSFASVSSRGQRKSLAITRAALCPGAPVTPPPGWVPAPHRYSPGSAPR
jgi:hypothetical protein